MAERDQGLSRMRRGILTPERVAENDHAYRFIESEPSVRISVVPQVVPQLMVLSDGPASSKRQQSENAAAASLLRKNTDTNTKPAKARRAISSFALYVLVVIVVLMMSLVALHSAIDT
jgi:hypothetical protein